MFRVLRTVLEIKINLRYLVILNLHCAHTSLHLRLRSTLGSLNMMCKRVINWFSLTKKSPSLETVFVVWKVREESEYLTMNDSEANKGLWWPARLLGLGLDWAVTKSSAAAMLMPRS